MGKKILPTINVQELLEVYEVHPCLWDKQNPQYLKRKARTAALQQMMLLFRIPDSVTLMKKIRNIRCIYNTEIRKIKQSMENGEVTYKPQLYWFDTADRFLRSTTDVQIEYKSSTNERTNPSHVPESCPDNSSPELSAAFRDDQVAELEIMEEFHEENSELNIQSTESVTASSSASSPTAYHNYCKRDRREPDESVLALQNILKIYHNEFMVFGQHVGLQLQDLPKREALELQNEISNLITKRRLELENMKFKMMRVQMLKKSQEDGVQ